MNILEKLNMILNESNNSSYVERLKSVKPHDPMTSSYYDRERKNYILLNSPEELYSHYFSGAKPGFRTIKHYFAIAKFKNDSKVMSKLLQVAQIIDRKDQKIRN